MHVRYPALLGALLAACAPAPDATTDAGAPADAGAPPTPLVCGELPSGVAAGLVGEPDDVLSESRRAVVLMGGGPEVDGAMRSFVEAAAGGDVVVLRASGSTESYLPYLFEELAADPQPSSVRVLRVDDPGAAGDAAMLCRVTAAEAVWLAGGDQSAYLLAWPAALHELLASTSTRRASIGGTSAGAMSLGELAFDAALGSVTSAEALAEPTAALVSVSPSPFAQPELQGFLVDTHFSERDREGRLLTFLAHARARQGLEQALGLGLDEETALVLGDGVAEVVAPFGGSAWLYRFAGAAHLAEGEPLALDVVDRAQLEHGAQLVWPPVWEGLTVTQLTVAEGVVSLR